MQARFPKAQPLRYYLYISDVKLDMLFEQIDRSLLKRISTEIKVDLKLASVTLRGIDNPGPSRMAKLRIVERYIEAHHAVGDTANPGAAYFRGRMEMQWGWLTHENSQGNERLPIVFFRGWGESHLVMLAGSRRHVLGNIDESEACTHMSDLPAIVAAIGESISEDPHIASAVRIFPHGFQNLSKSEIRAGFDRAKSLPAPFSGIISPTQIAMHSDPSHPDFAIRAGADVKLNSPPQSVEFLAIPLLEGNTELAGKQFHGILGTPLYVSLAQ